MTLQETIRADMQEAMKTKSEVSLRVLRGLLTSFTQELVATKRTPRDMLSDDEVIALIRRSLKQRFDAATQFRSGGREDLAVNEEVEAQVLEHYLPAQVGEEVIREVIEKKKQELAITDKSSMGRLMGAVMTELKGQADGGLVKKLLEQSFE